jgi:hypothetical protein
VDTVIDADVVVIEARTLDVGAVIVAFKSGSVAVDADTVVDEVDVVDVGADSAASEIDVMAFVAPVEVGTMVIQATSVTEDDVSTVFKADTVVNETAVVAAEAADLAIEVYVVLF